MCIKNSRRKKTPWLYSKVPLCEQKTPLLVPAEGCDFQEDKQQRNKVGPLTHK